MTETHTSSATLADGGSLAISATYTPAPPAQAKPSGTLQGGCIRSTAGGRAQLDTLYGGAPQVERIYSTGPASALLMPTDGRFTVVSFKSMPTGSDHLAIDKADVAFYQHEINAKDAKYRAGKPGGFPRASWLDDMGKMTTDVGICITANGLVDPAQDIASFIPKGWSGHMGVDFDGISNTDRYHDYSPELAAWEKFLAAHPEITSWGVPEHSANRAASDPTGAARAKWLLGNTRRFMDLGALYACVWESDDQVGSTFTTPIEVATVGALFALGARA